MSSVGIKGPIDRIWTWNVLPKHMGLSVWAPKWHNLRRRGTWADVMLPSRKPSRHLLAKMLMVCSVACSSSCRTITDPKPQDQLITHQLFNPKQTTLHLKSVVSGVYYTCTLQWFSDFSVSSTLKHYLIFKLQKNWAEAAKIYHILHLNVPSINNIFNSIV